MDILNAILGDPATAVRTIAEMEEGPADGSKTMPLAGTEVGIQWYRARRAMSFFAWDIYATAAIRHFRVSNSQPPSLNRLGIVVSNVAAQYVGRLQEEFFGCAEVAWHDQRPKGYSYDPYLNFWSTPEYRDAHSTHRVMSVGMNTLLNDILAALAGELETMLGHYWAAGAVRLYSHKPGADGGMHLDRWPLSVRKLMIYPSGASVEQGTTVVLLKGGQPAAITGGQGVCALFENSVLAHKAAAPQPGQLPRPTIEIPIMPAFRTDPTTKGGAINVGYPWLPPDIEGLEGENFPNGFTSAEVKQRSLLRTLMLALDMPKHPAIPDHCKDVGYMDT